MPTLEGMTSVADFITGYEPSLLYSFVYPLLSKDFYLYFY